MKIIHTGVAPLQANASDAGYDLTAFHDRSIAPGETALIKTGFNLAIPHGYCGMVCSRSGLALKHSVFVLNAPGIIDPQYRGDVGVLLHNASEKYFEVIKGDRVAQLIIVQVAHPDFVEVDRLDNNTDRGSNGFGSSGR